VTRMEALRELFILSGHPGFFYWLVGVPLPIPVYELFGICLPSPLSVVCSFIVGGVWGVVLSKNLDRFTKRP
jgi:hypothetical protein